MNEYEMVAIKDSKYLVATNCYSAEEVLEKLRDDYEKGKQQHERYNPFYVVKQIKDGRFRKQASFHGAYMESENFQLTFD